MTSLFIPRSMARNQGSSIGTWVVFSPLFRSVVRLDHSILGSRQSWPRGRSEYCWQRSTICESPHLLECSYVTYSHLEPFRCSCTLLCRGPTVAILWSWSKVRRCYHQGGSKRYEGTPIYVGCAECYPLMCDSSLSHTISKETRL